MLVGWCFTYLVEGVSGFGTPTALAAPILSSLGIDPLDSIVVCLIFNTLQTPFGAVGTPIWFGFGSILNETELEKVSYQTQIILCILLMVVAFLALKKITSWTNIWNNRFLLWAVF
jgi:lactate permease